MNNLPSSTSPQNRPNTALYEVTSTNVDKSSLSTLNQPSFTVVLRVMNNPTFDTIAQDDSTCSMISKAERQIYLRAQWQQLNALAGQMAASIKRNGGRMTQTEMAQARNLIDMMSAVEAEGQMTSNALANETRPDKDIIILGKMLTRASLNLEYYS